MKPVWFLAGLFIVSGLLTYESDASAKATLSKASQGRVSKRRMKKSARMWASLKTRSQPSVFLSRKIKYSGKTRVINPFKSKTRQPSKVER
jgi:hypothetical protein